VLECWYRYLFIQEEHDCQSNSGYWHPADPGTNPRLLHSKDPLIRTRAKKTLANWDYLFTFIKYEGVEPTNNLAEQKLRPAVQW
jgi:hypothetical protein